MDLTLDYFSGNQPTGERLSIESIENKHYIQNNRFEKKIIGWFLPFQLVQIADVHCSQRRHTAQAQPHPKCHK